MKFFSRLKYLNQLGLKTKIKLVLFFFITLATSSLAVDSHTKPGDPAGRPLAVPHKPVPQFRGCTKTISTGREALATRVLMIRNATETIDLSSYIFSDDEAGKIILRELKNALARGVSIRVLVDGVGGLAIPGVGAFGLSQEAIRTLESSFRGKVPCENGKPGCRATIDFRVFSPLWDGVGLKIPYRAHDKMLISDWRNPKQGAVLIGGRNTANQYFGAGLEEKGSIYQDLEMLIRSNEVTGKEPSILEAITKYFDTLFSQSKDPILTPITDWVVPLSNLYSSKSQERTNRAIQEFDAYRTESAAWLRKRVSELENDRSFLSPCSPSNLEFFSSISNVTSSDAPETNELHALPLDKLKEAKKAIDLVTPYLYLTDGEIRFLQKWVDADPQRRVRIITNSNQSTDNFVSQSMADYYSVPRLLNGSTWQNIKGQIQVYSLGRKDEKTVDGKLHAKYLVYDGKHSLVTSSNFDPISRYLNSEIGIFTDSKETAKELQTEVDRLSEGSYLWGSEDWKNYR